MGVYTSEVYSNCVRLNEWVSVSSGTLMFRFKDIHNLFRSLVPGIDDPVTSSGNIQELVVY
jgi:hypothetical protein